MLSLIPRVLQKVHHANKDLHCLEGGHAQCRLMINAPLKKTTRPWQKMYSAGVQFTNIYHETLAMSYDTVISHVIRIISLAFSQNRHVSAALGGVG